VHHLVADVRATLKDDVNAFELLASIFPGGSITGAPKLASMELIATLEGEQRGFFCGSLGFVDTRGEACFNILIRTLLWSETVAGEVPVAAVSLRVGGGITWASEARDEDQETLHKAKSLLAALGVTGLG
jgi:para-aminobenzoate synthetase component 1